jgi:hypothetical protein
MLTSPLHVTLRPCDRSIFTTCVGPAVHNRRIFFHLRRFFLDLLLKVFTVCMPTWKVPRPRLIRARGAGAHKMSDRPHGRSRAGDRKFDTPFFHQEAHFVPICLLPSRYHWQSSHNRI